MDSQRIQHHARQALAYTRELIDRYGGRLAGSAACHTVAERLRDDFASCGASACLEPFQVRPGAFNGFYRINVPIYFISVALLWFNQPLAAAVLLLFIVVAAGLQFGYYVEFYDRLFPEKTGYNLIATLEPRHKARQQLILSAHHDSAQELLILRSHQKLYGLKIIVPDFFPTMALIFSLHWLFTAAFYGAPPAEVVGMKLMLTIGAGFVLTKFFFFGRNATPGAGDNLIASAMLLELAKIFAGEEQDGRGICEDTRLIFVSFDAEEAGLRGSRAYARAHQDELLALPTRVLNIDSIYNVSELQMMVSDLNDHVKLDRALAEECQQIANRAGYPTRLLRMAFGGGGTDAAELQKVGVPSTTMIAMPAGLVRDGLVYHTMKDTVDAIEPQAVEACLWVASEWIKQYDKV